MRQSAAVPSLRTLRSLLKSGLLLLCLALAEAARGPRAASGAGNLGSQGEQGPGDWLARKMLLARNAIQRYRNVPRVIDELYSAPPKPLQVFEYGPSLRTFLLHPEEYKYQYVCVVSRFGDVEQAMWHRRKTPTRWTGEPPFHMRIVRPAPAGILHYMLTTGKAQLQKVEVTVTATNTETGEEHKVNRPVTMVVRTDKDKPRKQLSREKLGTKGKWGPLIPPEGMREPTALEEVLSRANVDLEELWEVANEGLKESGELSQ